MIKSITGSDHIFIEGGYSTFPTFYNNVGKELVGQLKYNASSQNLEVWDGSTWHSIIGANPTVKLSSAAQDAVNWAIRKMIEEREWENNQHPAVQAAYENLQRARQQLVVTAKLAEDQEQLQHHPV